MFILAELYSFYSIGGMLCLATIPAIVLGLSFYAKGVLIGSGMNATIFLLYILCLPDTSGDMTRDGILDTLVSNTPKDIYISNRTQTLFANKFSDNIVFAMKTDERSKKWVETDNYVLHNEEMHFGIRKNHILVQDVYAASKMYYNNSITGKAVDAIDYEYFYLYDHVYPGTSVRWLLDKEGGIPQWVWHPAGPLWVFAILGLPALLLGFAIGNMVKSD